MGFLGLCDGDPIVGTLRDVFHANIIRVPEERLVPLTVLAAAGTETHFIGALTQLLEQPAPRVPDVTASRMADVTGQRSRSIQVGLGLQILSGFLQGLGAGSVGLETQFTAVKTVSYSFDNVVRRWVDLAALSHTVAHRRIEKSSPVTASFFGQKPYAFLVLDSTITSSKFTISADSKSDDSFKFDLPGIQSIVGGTNAEVSVSSTSGLELHFSGPTPLAFAFSCVQFALSAAGDIISMLPNTQVRNVGFYAAFGHADHEYRYSPDHVLLSRETGMLDIVWPGRERT
jgi:hypothetical protein